jgi:putative ABC transport system substrate-binding protein
MKLTMIFRVLLSVILTAGTLLFLDLENRKSGEKKKEIKIAVFKISSRLVLDETEKGILEALSNRGYIDNKTCKITRFSPEGDLPTANMIAQNIVSNKFDIVITISTPALQIMANANKNGQVMHIFCAVTDPYVSGVGISGINPDQRPKHLLGIGTFQPVEKAFDIAKKMNPNLKKVGTVWCTSETCSFACVKLARKKCSEMGIELVELGVENTTQVLETSMAVTARGVDAIWIGGDNVVESGIEQVINAATRAKIPLFTNNPYNCYGNTLFGIGAEYSDVGMIAGNLAADVLDGKEMDTIGVKNIVPIRLNVNKEALMNMKDEWDISEFTKN